MEALVIGIEEMMPIYGYQVPEDAEKLKLVKKQFHSYRHRNPHLFPDPISRGKWIKNDVLNHLKTKPWLNKKPKRRIQSAKDIELRLA